MGTNRTQRVAFTTAGSAHSACSSCPHSPLVQFSPCKRVLTTEKRQECHHLHSHCQTFTSGPLCSFSPLTAGPQKCHLSVYHLPCITWTTQNRLFAVYLNADHTAAGKSNAQANFKAPSKFNSVEFNSILCALSRHQFYVMSFAHSSHLTYSNQIPPRLLPYANNKRWIWWMAKLLYSVMHFSTTIISCATSLFQ